MLCFAIKLAFDSPGIVRIGPESSVSVGGMVCCHCRRQSLLSELHEDVATVYVASSSIDSWHRSHAITWTLFRACKVRAKIKTRKEGNTERAVLESESWICSQLWPHYCRTCYFSKLMICISIKFFHYSFWIPNWSSFFVVLLMLKQIPRYWFWKVWRIFVWDWSDLKKENTFFVEMVITWRLLLTFPCTRPA